MKNENSVQLELPKEASITFGERGNSVKSSFKSLSKSVDYDDKPVSYSDLAKLFSGET